MSGAVCPACGVAVVPGYVKCPKCHRPLPRFARNSISPVGGTVVEEKQSNWMLWAFVGLVVVGVAYYFIHKAFEDYRRAGHAIMHRDAGVAAVEDDQPTQPTVEQPVVVQPTQPTGVAPAVHADDVARQLKTALQRQRLWSTVTVTGDHVEVRGNACADPGMKPAIDAVATQFHQAGLTKLRCLEQSGAVVFARDF